MIYKKKKKIINFLLIFFIFINVFNIAGCTEEEQKSNNSSYETWCNYWSTVNNDKSFVSITPGSDSSMLNFAWYTKKNNLNPQVKISKNKDLSEGTVFSGITADAVQNYKSNKVTVSNLEANTVYYYACGNNDKFGKINSIKTQSDKEFSFILVGDPQIGASAKNKTTKSKYNACRDDSYKWNTTIKKAMITVPNASFIISAGDQVQSRDTTATLEQQKKYTGNEIEYTGFLCPKELRNIPLATAIGNHDSLSGNYSYHFNNPNASNLGSTVAGGDYYFTYGNSLFIFLNSNNSSRSEHKKFIKNAITNTKNIRWKIVVMHQDIYGSGIHSNQPNNVKLRYKLTSIFDEYGIDVVLSGHDHSYSRSEILKGAKIDNNTFISQDEYNSYISNGKLKDKKYNNYINSIQDSNAIVKVDKKETDNDITVTNPNGVLYITASSSSGSKYYKLEDKKQSYIAKRWQKNVPTFSSISINQNSFSITTYRSDTTETIDKIYTIVKK